MTTKFELTDLDKQIIGVIEQNGRATNRDIAKFLGISERQAGLRLRRLIEGDAVRVITVVDVSAVGFQIVLSIGIQVSERPAGDVARDIAKLPNVIAVALMAGIYQIEAMVVVESMEALAQFTKDRLSAIPGIHGLHPSLFLDVVKFETGSGPVIAQTDELAIPEHSELDDVDRAIIGQLWKNASETNDSIATVLGLSEATVRKRVGLLRERNIIHITSMRNIAIGRDVIFAIIGIDVHPGQTDAAITALAALREVHVLAAVLGRYSLVAQVLVENTGELTRLLDEKIARAPGVRTAVCSQAVGVVKFDYRWRIIRHGR